MDPLVIALIVLFAFVAGVALCAAVPQRAATLALRATGLLGFVGSYLGCMFVPTLAAYSMPVACLAKLAGATLVTFSAVQLGDLVVNYGPALRTSILANLAGIRLTVRGR